MNVEKSSQFLLSFLSEKGEFQSQLSASALSSALALTALTIADADKYAPQVSAGLAWLTEHQNADGGWGDTPESPSNLSTTLICWSALAITKSSSENPTLLANEKWLIERIGSLEPDQIVASLLEIYGKDKTFSIPILMMCCLCGRLGPDAQGWNRIPPLPFELAALPHSFFKFIKMPVVSYALPALIAIGQVIDCKKTKKSFYAKLFRSLFKKLTIKKLAKIQPTNGGFLEAIPLTSFVVMSLLSAGYKDKFINKSIDFLANSMRTDGSWPIDTNISTWTTTLAVNALYTNDTDPKDLVRYNFKLKKWILDQQYKELHAFTNAKAGGWGWTNLPGAVPDADDTSSALCALYNLDKSDAEVRLAAVKGIEWLLDLQNRDGGMPTFCRGWGSLPFDRSCPDISANALQAWLVWHAKMPAPIQKRIECSSTKILKYLKNTQNVEGSWYPLWFGNQQAPQQNNPVYGTTKVLSALAKAKEVGFAFDESLMISAVEYLLKAQNKEGSWGGDIGVAPSIEETALALHSLSLAGVKTRATELGYEWLSAATADWTKVQSSPIGLYFASLWYHEKLYPIIFSVAAFKASTTKSRI